MDLKKLIVHNLQKRSATRPSILKNKNAGGSGHLTREDGIAYCLDGNNLQAIEIPNMDLKRWDDFNKIWSNPQEAGALKAGGNNPNLLVSMPTKSINTPVKSTGKTMEKENCMKGISEKLQQNLFQITTYSLVDFLARLSVLLESEKDLEILVELSSLKYAELWKKRNLIFFSLKTSKGYLITMGGTRSELSSIAFQNWGMTVNGKCLTARISESRKTGKECSLSDILEEQVDEKYFLSEKVVKRLMSYVDSKLVPLQQGEEQPNQTATTLLKVTGRHYEK